GPQRGQKIGGVIGGTHNAPPADLFSGGKCGGSDGPESSDGAARDDEDLRDPRNRRGRRPPARCALSTRTVRGRWERSRSALAPLRFLRRNRAAARRSRRLRNSTQSRSVMPRGQVARAGASTFLLAHAKSRAPSRRACCKESKLLLSEK